MVRCSDNSSYHGDILVGADGAYSAVRQNLYKDLKVGKKLPAKDDVSLPFSCVCLVGQTVPLDPEEFTQLQGDLGKNNVILGTETMCTVSLRRIILQVLFSPFSLSSLQRLTLLSNHVVGDLCYKAKHGVLDGDPFLGQGIRQAKRFVPQLRVGS
jgi:2-polyprenyl-6-methoxyphenol hydroxylase-like FAD-dependent oxidoreductase